VRYLKNERILSQFGNRLRTFRETAELSQEQVHYATGIGQANISQMESGGLNTGLSQIALLSEFFGIEDHELLDYKAAIPETEDLRKSISRFCKKRNINPSDVLKKSITIIFERKLIPSKFLASPRFTKEIAQHLLEKYDAEFSTTLISRTLGIFSKRGLIERIATNKKSKFQYKKS
jgi:transcriptional regulator with XRE-family HTH domain